MAEYTPAVVHEFEQVDESLLKQNLFKDQKVDLKGQHERLQAFLRIRPIDHSYGSSYWILDETTLRTTPPEDSQTYKNGTKDSKDFLFTKIFNDNASQQTIFQECALPAISKFLNGFNCLMFAYGTTCSGKSYTMQGTSDCPGVIPRTIKTVFEALDGKMLVEPRMKPQRFAEVSCLNSNEIQQEIGFRKFILNNVKGNDKTYNAIQSLSASNTTTFGSNEIQNTLLSELFTGDQKFICWVSFCEFHNENLIDLLSIAGEDGKAPKLSFLRDTNQNYYVKNLRYIFCSSPEEAYKTFIFGISNRQTAATKLNSQSSRSHSCFSLVLISFEDKDINSLSVNRLSFCDLAGAERSQKTQNVGTRLKETGKINSSLMCLSRCITAIRNNQRNPKKPVNVPYNDSKITKLFQPYLSQSGIASMIINVNPSPDFFDETVTSLNFGVVASNVVVSDEASRRALRDQLKRLTHMWLKSTQRWSQFDDKNLKNNGPSFSPILDAEIFEENEEDLNPLNSERISLIQSKLDEITQDFESLTPDMIEMYNHQIQHLIEKLKASENEKMDLEVKIRDEVGKEIDKITNGMMEDQEYQKARLERMNKFKLDDLSRKHKKEVDVLKKRIEELESKTLAEESTETLQEFNKPLFDKISTLEKENEEIPDLRSKLNQLEQDKLSVEKLNSLIHSEQEKKIESLEKKILSFEKIVHEIDCTKNNFESENTMIKNLNTNYQNEISSLKEKYTQDLSSLNELIKTQSEELVLFKQNIGENVRLLSIKDEELENLKQKCEKSDKENANFKREIENLNQELGNLRGKYEKNFQDLKITSKNIKSLEDEKSSLISEHERQINFINEKHSKDLDLLNRKLSEYEQLLNDIPKLKESLISKDLDLASKDEEIENLQKDLSVKNKEILAFKRSLKEKDHVINTKEEILKEKDNKLENLKLEIRNLETKQKCLNKCCSTVPANILASSSNKLFSTSKLTTKNKSPSFGKFDPKDYLDLHKEKVTRKIKNEESEDEVVQNKDVFQNIFKSDTKRRKLSKEKGVTGSKRKMIPVKALENSLENISPINSDNDSLKRRLRPRTSKRKLHY